jgi:hypothetical protein
MNRFVAVAVTLGLTIAAAAPAWADGWGWRHHYRPYGYYYGAPVVVYPPPPPVVVYQAAPPPPMMYAPPQQPQPVEATPMSPIYNDGMGRYCREYQSTVMVGNTPQSSYGTACQQPDGTWQIVR